MSKVSEFIESRSSLVKEYVELLRGIELEAGRSGIIIPFAANELPENGTMIAFEGGVIIGFEKDNKVYVYFDIRSPNAVRLAVSNALKKLPNNTICDDLVFCNEDGMFHGVDALLEYATELEFDCDDCRQQKSNQGFH